MDTHPGHGPGGHICSGSTITVSTSDLAAIMKDPTVTPNELGQPMLQVYRISNGFLIKVDSTLLGEGVDSSLVYAETEADVAKQVTAIYARHKVLYKKAENAKAQTVTWSPGSDTVPIAITSLSLTTALDNQILGTITQK